MCMRGDRRGLEEEDVKLETFESDRRSNRFGRLAMMPSLR